MKKIGLVFLFCFCAYFVNAEEFLKSAPKPNSSNKEYCIDDLSSLDNPWLQTVAQVELFIQKINVNNPKLKLIMPVDIKPKGQITCATQNGCLGIMCTRFNSQPSCPNWATYNICTPLPNVPCGGPED